MFLLWDLRQVLSICDDDSSFCFFFLNFRRTVVICKVFRKSVSWYSCFFIQRDYARNTYYYRFFKSALCSASSASALQLRLSYSAQLALLAKLSSAISKVLSAQLAQLNLDPPRLSSSWAQLASARLTPAEASWAEVARAHQAAAQLVLAQLS